MDNAVSRRVPSPINHDCMNLSSRNKITRKIYLYLPNGKNSAYKFPANIYEGRYVSIMYGTTIVIIS
jgi:hypothetical protein